MRYTARVKTRLFLASLTLGLGTFFAAPAASAAPATITYTYRHHLITVNVAQHPEWKHVTRTWFYGGVAAVPPSRLKTCGAGEINEPGWSFQEAVAWNEAAIERTLVDEVASKIDREPGSVVIRKSVTGSIVFDGIGLTGQKTDVSLAANLTMKALAQDIATIVLPVVVTQPAIDVQDAELRAQGIKEVVTVGESVFTKSPVNRRHNIGVGVQKFNGHLIPQDSIFSFNEVLGPVNDKTGYRKELVIQGDETLPDYGGGLCQVSSTAYRGPWEYGMPIVQRKNHSYAVSYYSPQGTDATIYPPNVNMRFLNDTPGALLIQSFVDDQDRAFFIYYGTRDERTTEVMGPYVTDRVSAPKEEKISYTTEIPPGQKRKASERHDGMKVTWYRTVQRPGSGAVLERFFSAYQTRPLYWQVGVTPEEMERLTSGAASESPSWLPTSDLTSSSNSSSSSAVKTGG